MDHGSTIYGTRLPFIAFSSGTAMGQDVNAKLPAPATYMGHVDVGSTQIYIQATPELYEQAHQRFLTYVRNNNITHGGLS